MSVSPSREPRLVELLAGALRERRLEVATDFELDGTDIRSDLFLPGAPKAFVLIKDRTDLATYLSLPRAFANQRALEDAGRNALVFLVSDRHAIVGSGPEARKLLDRTRYVGVDLSETADLIAATQIAAAEIAREVHAERRKARSFRSRYVGTRDSGWVQASWDDHADDLLFLMAREVAPGGVSRHAPSLSAVARQCEAILASFKDLVPPERFATLDHEVQQLLEEHQREHFTACALRVGRCLELIVYSLASEWGVRVDEQLLSTLDHLERESRRIGSMVLNLRDATEPARTRVRNGIIKAIERLQGHLVRFTANFESETPVEKAAPRNVAAILRDIARTYGASRVIRETVGVIEPMAQTTLDHRNQAAHADIRGRPREVDRESVDQMLRTLQRILFELSRIGEEIASGPSTSDP